MLDISQSALGSNTLGSSHSSSPWRDTISAFVLVARGRHAAPMYVTDAPFEELNTGGGPVEVARAWLADPSHTASIPQSLIDCARRSLDIAESHFREVDLLAGEVASDAVEVGVVDEGRVQAIETLAEVFYNYSAQLRLLLDQAPANPTLAEQRLRNAIEAADRGGGLRALVRAM